MAAWLWMLSWIALGLCALAIGFAGGCGRTVLVSEGSPMRAGEAVRTKVYTLVDGKWRLSDNQVTVPEGWYIVPPSFVENDR